MFDGRFDQHFLEVFAREQSQTEAECEVPRRSRRLWRLLSWQIGLPRDVRPGGRALSPKSCKASRHPSAS